MGMNWWFLKLSNMEMNAQYDIIRICIYETFHKNNCKITLHDNYGMQQFHIRQFFFFFRYKYVESFP